MTARSVNAFAGFPPDAWSFLTGLEADNTKAFFDTNRRRYEDHLAGPSRMLVESLADLLPERFDLDVRAEPKVGRSLFRINRDTRFTTDQTPYKTHLDFLFWVGAGPPRTRPAFIMRLTASDVLVGGGRMAVAGDARDAYRAALDDPRQGTIIRTAVDTLAAVGAELSDPHRAKPPRPFPPDHPNADLLRRDGFHLTRTTPHPAAADTPAFAGWCADALAPFAPIVAWFAAIEG